jgi:aromatic-amino-acid transaminase
MLADLGQVAAGDIVLLHGCCHNPTGANLNLVEWAAVADLLVAKGAIPLIDLAYQGFGDGLEADAAPTRTIAACCPEVLIAASCSKNFGIYRERTGLLIGLGSSAQRGLIQGNLAFLNRQNYSFPPDHGARLVTMILEDPALTTVWRQELEEIRLNMLTLRQSLAMELRRLTGSDRWGFIAQHRGMFSRLGATEAEVARMRAERGIYMVSDSRLNIAGLNAATVPVLAQAIADIVA